MLKIKNLNKAYGKKELFKDFSIVIEDKEFVMINGSSGSGKTTLLNMIGSLEKPDSGEILFNDIDIFSRKGQIEYLREHAGFVFQNFALVDGKTVRENLKLVDKSVRTGISFEDALSYVGVKELIDTKVYKLSGGEQQRVAMARLMIKKCDLILADEPTGSLDRKNADIIIDIMKDFNKMGKTIVMVTHDERYKNIGNKAIELTE